MNKYLLKKKKEMRKCSKPNSKIHHFNPRTFTFYDSTTFHFLTMKLKFSFYYDDFNCFNILTSELLKFSSVNSNKKALQSCQFFYMMHVLKIFPYLQNMV